jgi:hypothetical protein
VVGDPRKEEICLSFRVFTAAAHADVLPSRPGRHWTTALQSLPRFVATRRRFVDAESAIGAICMSTEKRNVHHARIIGVIDMSAACG